MNMPLTIELLKANLTKIQSEREGLWAQVQQALGAEQLLRSQIAMMEKQDQGGSPTDNDIPTQ